MVIGIDTYHDSSARGKSAGGFVASVNSTLTRSVTVTPGACYYLCNHNVTCSLHRYYCQCMFQHPGQELGDNFKTAMIGKHNILHGGLLLYGFYFRVVLFLLNTFLTFN